MNLENIGKDCPCYEVDCSDIMFDIGEFCGLPPNNGKLTIQVNGSTVGDFSANQQEDKTINITTPTSQDIADAVDGEARLREQADNTLQSNINAEELARQRADRDIQAVLDGESLARVNEDRNLQSQIDAIASKSDVVDVVGTYAELQSYDTSKLNDNDVVKVLDDSTHNDSMTYYRWNKTTQTWSYIGQESPYYSKSQTDGLLAQKQDNLTAGTGITLNGSTISADTTVLAEKSELSNYAEKSDTYTKTEVDNLVEPKLSVDVVEQLPVQGDQNKLYLTEKAHTTQTATGNPITATITDGAGQIEDFQLDGDTFQQSYSGKNLFVYGESSAASGLSVSYNAQTGGITVQGTTTSNYPNISMGVNSLVTAGTYTMSITQPLSVNLSLRCIRQNDTYPTGIYIPAGQTDFTFTLDFTPKRIDVLYSVGATGVVVPETTFYLQIEAGSSATDYEPFVGGMASPNPDYPQPIQTVTGEQTVEVRGKNLFNIDNYSSAVLRGGGSAVSVAKENATTLKLTNLISQGANFCGIPIPNSDNLLGKSVTISGTVELGTGVSDARVAVYAGSSTSVGTSVASTNISASGSFTLAASIPASYPSGADRIHYVIYASGNSSPAVGSTVIYSNLQMEIGSATTYAPYSKTEYPISLGSIELCKLGTYQDYIYKDGDTWKVHKATKKKTLNGSEDWLKDTNGGYTRFNIQAQETIYVGERTPIGLSSHFVSSKVNAVGIFFLASTGIARRFYFYPETNITTVEGFESWLESNNTILVYPLATSTDIVITDSALIAQLEAVRNASLENGSNTITNTATGSNLAGDMEVDYFGYDPTNRYDKWLWLDINNAYEKLGS